MSRRVFVTGMGIVSGLGIGLDETLLSLKVPGRVSGKSNTSIPFMICLVPKCLCRKWK